MSGLSGLVYSADSSRSVDGFDMKVCAVDPLGETFEIEIRSDRPYPLSWMLGKTIVLGERAGDPVMWNEIEIGTVLSDRCFLLREVKP